MVFMLLIILTTAVVRIIQLVIGRCFDIDDIMLNIVGGMLGYFIYRLLDKVTNNMSKKTISTILISAIIIATVILLYIMMWGRNENRFI